MPRTRSSKTRTRKSNKHTTVNSIMEIATDDINDDYCWGNYGNFKVIIMKKNGYINATKIVSDACEDKKFNDWASGEDAIELIEAVAEFARIPVDEIMITITGGNDSTIRGTYAHPGLIPNIASWASPEFAIKMTKILRAYANQFQ